jgi:hypothetical protein
MCDRSGECIRRNAEFHGKNRLTLSRTFGPGPRALVIGCNPSDADALRDDPTSIWWNRWFEADGFGGYDAVNLYPICTSSPAECRRIVAATDHGARDVRDDIHFVNLAHIVAKAKAASKVFVCWGAIAWDIDWVEHVVEAIQSGEAPCSELWCWGTTQSGAPKHPMARGKHRILTDQPAILWRAASCSVVIRSTVQSRYDVNERECRPQAISLPNSDL